MNRLSLIKMLIVLGGLSGAAFAQTAGTLSPPADSGVKTIGKGTSTAPVIVSKFEISGMGGLAFFDRDSSGIQNPGFGGGIRGIFFLDPQFGVGFSAGYHAFTGSVYTIPTLGSNVTKYVFSQDNLEFLGSVKINIGDNRNLHPYLLGGMGFTLFAYSRLSYIYPAIQAGGGVEVAIQKNINLFLEAKENLAIHLFNTDEWTALEFISDSPLEAGFTFQL